MEQEYNVSFSHSHHFSSVRCFPITYSVQAAVIDLTPKYVFALVIKKITYSLILNINPFTILSLITCDKIGLCVYTSIVTVLYRQPLNLICYLCTMASCAHPRERWLVRCSPQNVASCILIIKLRFTFATSEASPSKNKVLFEQRKEIRAEARFWE